jgi:hypothetical protein
MIALDLLPVECRKIGTIVQRLIHSKRLFRVLLDRIDDHVWLVGEIMSATLVDMRKIALNA